MTDRKTPLTSPNSELSGETNAACARIGVGCERRFFGKRPAATLCILAVFGSFSIGGFSDTAIAQTATPAETPSVPVDYSAITKPEVAASLMLTPEQKALIAQIVAERDSALTAAEEAARPAIAAAAGRRQIAGRAYCGSAEVVRLALHG